MAEGRTLGHVPFSLPRPDFGVKGCTLPPAPSVMIDRSATGPPAPSVMLYRSATGPPSLCPVPYLSQQMSGEHWSMQELTSETTAWELEVFRVTGSVSVLGLS